MTYWPELFVLRHGQTLWNAEGRHQGRLNSDLTDLGRAQAAMQGRILRAEGLAARAVDCVASPAGRAWQTAEIALGEIGGSARADERLVEIGFGRWQGLTVAEIDLSWPGNRDRVDLFDWHFTAPGGESFDDLVARARGFLDDLRGPSVVVTHGITSRVIRGLWLGLDQVGMGALPGGQGVVYHLRDGAQRCLEAPV